MWDDSDHQSVRRSFLKSIGVLGAAATVGPGAASAADEANGDGADDSLGEYRRALREELTAPSRQQKQLPAGAYVWPDERDALDAFEAHGGETATVDVETDAVPVTTAERVTVPAEADDPADVVYRGAVSDASFDAGDLLLGVAWVRSDDGGATARARFGSGDLGSGENRILRGADVAPSDEWLRYFFPVEVDAGTTGADGPVALEFLLGETTGAVEFGGLALIDYGDDEVSAGALPPYDYAGRSPDADWREAAHERIDEVRKTDVAVEVRNPGGEAMSGATVDVTMSEHDFDFGSAVSVEHVTGDTEDDRIYRERFRDLFNKAVVENGLKYPAWEGVWDIDNDDTRATLDWLDDHDVPTRGHYLLWEEYGTAGGGGMNVDADQPADEIEAEIAEKIADHAAEYEGQVTEWDVHNHPVWQSNFRDDPDLGWEAVDRWWRAADDATDAELHTNEMGVIGGQWQREAYYDYVRHLVENDYPIDAVGFMGHHQQQWNQLLDVEDLLAGLDRFSEFGLPLIVTEFDIQIFDRRNAQDVAVQRDYLRDFLTATFAAEAVEGVVSWGFWAEDHWRPSGAYFDADWTLRPHGEQFRDLVFEEWWTDEAGETDESGTYVTRAFKGDYAVTAEKGSLSGETTVTVDDDTDRVVVELTPPGNEGEGGTGGGEENGNGDA